VLGATHPTHSIGDSRFHKKVLSFDFIQREFDNRRFEGVARRATPSKRRFFVGVGAAHPHEKSLVELMFI
jgi:hypothetical protein